MRLPCMPDLYSWEQDGDPYPLYVEDMDVPEGAEEANVFAAAAGEIRAKGNELFKAVKCLPPCCPAFSVFAAGTATLLNNFGPLRASGCCAGEV